MKYDLSSIKDMTLFKRRVMELTSSQKKVELKELREVRTLKQNSYLHVVLNLYAINFGHTLNEAKTDLKRDYGLIYEKNWKKYLISTTILDTKELTEFIEYIRTRAAKENCYIPTAEEYLTNKFNIDREIDKHKEFL